ncbi:uncharacterized protein LOC127136529 [Lathyrus oleraceus]|uniref:uncharacterized protein LOC127136529 n=1 Tax=Pisum sativum TaxID=3888 RepID=UPI0021D26EFA|nr:uncharacterized protein LOC127136529 [Pisum sativum]
MNSHSTTHNGKHANLWILDTGATNHISFDKTAFLTCTNIIQVHVNLPDGSHITASMFGNVIVSPYLTLHNVLYMPNFHVNLISIIKLVSSNNCSIHFTVDTCQIMQNLSKAMIGTTRLQRGLYVLDYAPQPSSYNLIANDTFFNEYDHIPSSSHSLIHNTDTYSPVDNNQSAQSFPNSCTPSYSIFPTAVVDNTLSIPIALTDNLNPPQPMRQPFILQVT